MNKKMRIFILVLLLAGCATNHTVYTNVTNNGVVCYLTIENNFPVHAACMSIEDTGLAPIILK